MDSKNIARNLAVVPVPVLIATIFFFGIIHPSAKVIEPPYLFPILNTVFLFLVSCVVAYVAMRSYLATGSSPILLLGVGVLVFGTGSFASGWTIVRWGVNVSATVHNAPLLLAAIFHICGVVASAKEQPPETDPARRRWKLFAAYITAPVFVFSVFLLSVEGIMPVFFIAGVGTTALRQAVLASAFVLLVYSSAYMMTRFLWKKEPYLYWYSLALALLAVMSGGFYIQPAIGSPVGWVGRGAQYLAGVYFIVSVISARREAQKRGASLNETVADLFLTPGFHWQDILKTALNGFSIVDSKGRFLEVNDACCRMLGYTRPELLSMTIADVETVESPSDVLSHIEALKEKKTDYFLTQHRRKDGSIIEVEVNATYLDIGSGQIAFFVQDITERKLAEEALHQSEERYRSLFDNMTEGFAVHEIVTDPTAKPVDYRFLAANSSFERLTGLKRGDIIGRLMTECLPGDDPEWIELYGKVALTGEPLQLEKYSSALKCWYEVFAYRCAPRQFAVIFMDITKRKLAEEDLRRNEARFRLLSDTAGRLLATNDPQGLINNLCRDVMVHLDCQAFFNFMVDESAGRLRLNACAGIPEAEARKLEWLDYGVAVCGCVARDAVRIIAEDIFHTPDVRTELVKSYGIQAYCCHPLKAQDRLIGTLSFGTKTRARFTLEEVELMRVVADQVSVAVQRIRIEHDLRQSEEALRKTNLGLEERVEERTMELQSLAKQLERHRDELRKLASELVMAEERERKRIAGVLHDDIAQILAAARMRLGLLERTQSDHNDKQTLGETKELLTQSIRETRALMNDLGNPLLFDVGLQAACESLSNRLMEKHSVRISCDIGDAYKQVNPDVKAILYQLIRELLNNVVKHSHAQNAHVLIHLENGHFRVKVKDDGVGFDTQTLGAPTIEGGFGLYSIRERLIAIDGSLNIASAPGTGTVVTAILPASLD